jgi:molecular chaperone DnaK
MRELAEARNSAETLIYSTEKSLREHRESLDEETIGTIESRIEELRGVLDGSDAGEIRGKSESLMEAAHSLAQAVYQQAQAQQAQQAQSQAANGDTGSDDDEVVEEADYEVIDEEAKQS